MTRMTAWLLTLLLLLSMAQGCLATAETIAPDVLVEADEPTAQPEQTDNPTPEPEKTVEPTPDSTPKPDVAEIPIPASVGETLYMGTESTLTMPASAILAGIVVDYYKLGTGRFNAIHTALQGDMGAILNGGALPAALSDYADAINAAVSDIQSGFELSALKKQLNGKKKKKVSLMVKGVPQTTLYAGSPEEGYAFTLSGLKGTTKLSSGTYYLQLEVVKKNAPALYALYGEPKQLVVQWPLKMKKQSSGGGGGSGGTTEKQLPVARLLVDDVRLEPESPSAGDTFDIVLTLRNSSQKLSLGNIQLTFSSENDVLEPVSGTNAVYIDSIDADSVYEQRLTVRAKPDLENPNVKLDLSAEFEDKKLTALTATHSVMIRVNQVQRIQLDEPSLPTTTPMTGDSYEMKMGVFNLGKTILYNVTARAVPENAENVTAGASYFVGNMEPGTSKTVELELIPLVEGEHRATLEVTYETVNGEPTTVTKNVTFSAAAMEEYDPGFTDEPLPDLPIEPAAPSTMDILRALPWQLYALAGGFLLVLILWMGVAARRRRLRALEDDEMD